VNLASLGAGLCAFALAALRFHDLMKAVPESPAAVNAGVQSLILGFSGVLLAAFAYVPPPPT
jgi:hypothetical protein